MWCYILLAGIRIAVGVVGYGEGVMYIMSPGRPSDIGLHLGKACYPLERGNVFYYAPTIFRGGGVGAYSITAVHTYVRQSRPSHT